MSVRWGRGFFMIWIVLSLIWGGVVFVMISASNNSARGSLPRADRDREEEAEVAGGPE